MKYLRGLQMQVGPFTAVPVPGVAAMVPSDEVIRWLHKTTTVARGQQLPTRAGNAIDVCHGHAR